MRTGGLKTQRHRLAEADNSSLVWFGAKKFTKRVTDATWGTGMPLADERHACMRLQMNPLRIWELIVPSDKVEITHETQLQPLIGSGREEEPAKMMGRELS
jgi:hypothetical protein